MMQRQAIESYVIEVTLLDSPTPVARILSVPARLSMKRLHDAIQISMGWKDEHLFEFKYGPYVIAPQDQNPDDEREITDAGGMTLARLEVVPNDFLTYLYDFGDYWIHLLRVRGASSEKVDRPHCVEGQGVCPPEDVGGVYGYEHFLEVLAHPDHEEHAELKAWAEGWWDPTPFSAGAVEARLASRFRAQRRRQSTKP